MDDVLLVDDYMVREKSCLFDRNKQGRPDSRQQDKWLKQQSCTGQGHVGDPTGQESRNIKFYYGLGTATGD